MSCFIAGSISRKIGVISPVSPSEDLQDIKELALVKEGHGKIVHIERLKKRSGNNSWEDSTSLKCIFEADKLPIAITIAHSYYRVRPYVEEPRRCYNCQRFGHMAGSCRSSTKCRICGENHKQELCNKPPELSKCANCGGGHVANSRDCEIYNTAWEIEKIKAHKDTSYAAARSEVMGMKNGKNYAVNVSNHSREPEIPQHNNVVKKASYRNAVIKNHKSNDNQPRRDISSSFIETNKTAEKPFITLSYEDLAETIKKCFVEIFQSNIINKSLETQETVIDNAIKKSFSAMTKGKLFPKIDNVTSSEGNLVISNSLDSLDSMDEGVLSPHCNRHDEDHAANVSEKSSKGKRKLIDNEIEATNFIQKEGAQKKKKKKDKNKK